MQRSSAVRARLRYVCDVLFDGNVARFAGAIGVNYSHLHSVRWQDFRPSLGLLAQIVLHTDVQATWLLTGHGPPFVPPASAEAGRWPLPFEIQSEFTPVSPLALTGLPNPEPDRRGVGTRCVKAEPPAEAYAAAKLIHGAHVLGRPVPLWLGRDVGAPPFGRAWTYRCVYKKYVTSVALTAATAAHDQPPRGVRTDLVGVARLAAQNSCGLGEGLARWGHYPPRNTRSVVRAAWMTRMPITVHAELGECVEHFQPYIRGAEIGACLGAALYVDLLIWTEQLRRLFAAPAGVLLLAGESLRAWQLVETAWRALPRPDKPPAWAVVVVGDHLPGPRADAVAALGAQLCVVPGEPRAACQHLLTACEQVYLGKHT